MANADASTTRFQGAPELASKPELSDLQPSHNPSQSFQASPVSPPDNVVVLDPPTGMYFAHCAGSNDVRSCCDGTLDRMVQGLSLPLLQGLAPIGGGLTPNGLPVESTPAPIADLLAAAQRDQELLLAKNAILQDKICQVLTSGCNTLKNPCINTSICLEGSVISVSSTSSLEQD